ncbi:MAG: outer membrane protein assembly factor BamA, partial [Nonlabens sp.]
MLFLNIGIGQNNQLQIAFKKTELSPADSLVQLPLKEKNSNQQTDSIRTALLKRGYLNLLINKRQKINDSLQQIDIVLNRKYSHVQFKEYTNLGLETLKVISLSRKRNFIPINEIENYLYDLNNSIQQEGFPFTKTQLSHFKFNNSDTIEAALTVSQRKKRFLNRITIKGYDKFPTNTLQNLTKRRNTYNDKTIGRLEKSLENMPFVKKTKDTEVLFKQDSTNVFIYLEKIKTNSADGLIGFNNSNNGKLELNGYVHLKLQNN